MLGASEQFAHYYRGTAIRDTTGLWPSRHEIDKIFEWGSAAQRIGGKFKAN